MHTLIIGQPEQGKSTLAKIIVRQAAQAGTGSVVLDPIGDDWGPSAIIVDSVEDMIEYAKAPENANKLLVIDESSISFDHYDKKQHWVAKIARHNGHSSIFIGQNVTDVPKGVRTMCTQLFVFASSRTDARELSDQFDDDMLLSVTKLPKLHFVRIVNRQATRGMIDIRTMQILMQPAPVKPMVRKMEKSTKST